MKKILGLFVSMLLLSCLVLPVAADAIVVITGQAASVQAEDILFGTVTLDGTDKVQDGTTSAWVANDPSGTGDGWHLVITATDFANAGGKTIAATGFKMKVLDTDVTAVENASGLPTASVTFADFSSIATSQTFVTANGDNDDGMGEYQILPAFKLDVPASTYAGDYTSTVTVDIVVP